jgi:hypothetical protein
MGRMPLHTSSALVDAKLGKTRPGQSQRRTLSLRWIVWKCFVLPGVEETETFLEPIRALIVDDFPTLGYPTRPICVFRGLSES